MLIVLLVQVAEGVARQPRSKLRERGQHRMLLESAVDVSSLEFRPIGHVAVRDCRGIVGT